MAKPAPSGSATTTTFQIGTYNPLLENGSSDGFTLTADLNDGGATFIMPTTMKAPAPEKTYVETGNIRSPGISVVRWQYKNRTIDLSISIRRSNYANMQATLATIKSALENPPYSIRFAYPGASQYSYFDVVECTHNIPSDPILWLNNALPHYEIHFVCMPGIRGDRVTLQNLAPNPGFEAVAGGGTAAAMPTAFSDGFANANAYHTVVGGAATFASNLVTVPAGAIVTFGSPAWGGVSLWQIRFKWVTGNVADFCIHYTNTANRLVATIDGSKLFLDTVVGNVYHDLTTPTATLTNGNFYWLAITHFPSLNGNAPMLQAVLSNDSAGSIGTTIVTAGPVNTFDAVTAMFGQMAIFNRSASAGFSFGGAFVSNVTNFVSLYGPGGWSGHPQLGSSTACSSCAWDGTRQELGMSGSATAGTQTYPNGPVTSAGSARIDFPFAGTVDASWNLYSGGTPAGTQAMPVATTGDVMYVGAQVKSSVLGNGATIALKYTEYNAAGSSLRSGTLQTFTVSGGVQAAWAAAGSYTLSGNWTTGANCAFVDIQIEAADTVAGNSGTGTVWIDNVQVWDSTTTGLTTMSYHELRFPNSPAQLMVSGLAGDMPAPAWLALGTYYASPSSSTAFSFALGRMLQARLGAQLVTVTSDYAPTPVLDSSAYGGFYESDTTVEIVPTLFAPRTNTLLGTFHLFTRFWTNQSSGNLPNVKGRPLLSPSPVAFRAGYNTAQVQGAQIAAVSSSSTWTPADVGQVNIPAIATGALADPSQSYTFVAVDWDDSTGGSPTMRINWGLLLPIDASLISGAWALGNNLNSYTNSEWWLYYDGIGSQISAPFGAPTWSREATPIPNAAHASGSVAAAVSFLGITYPSVATSQDAWITLDPTEAGAGDTANGVNVLAGFMADQTGAVLALHSEVQYSPLYLAPR